MSDMRWLKLKGRKWFVFKEVPRELRGKVLSPRTGKPTKRLIRSLDTDSLIQAQARRYKVLAEFESLFEKARQPARAATLVEAAMDWREHLLAQTDPADQIVAEHDIQQSAATIPDPSERGTFLAVATGQQTPLMHYLESWLAEGGAKGPYSARTQRQYRNDLGELQEWLLRSGLPPTIEAVSKPAAGRYMTSMVEAGADRTTANRKMASASSYWRWLMKRTSVEVTPWSGQSIAKGSARNGVKAKRPFTDDEVAILLSGPASQELADAMRVAALSGMRVEEIYRLTVADCADGVFRINRAKTEAGVRAVPVHSALAAIVARRMEGKPADAFLFHEAGGAREGRERSASMTGAFGHYRQRLGVHAKLEGRRQSQVDFHSFRRWFVTACEQAHQPVSTIESVVGHARKGMTLGRYSGGPTLEMRRACVEAVKLPV